MPRKAFFSKEEIVEKGLAIAREGGLEALTARSLSKQLGCSLSPLFTVFDNMDEIKDAVRKAAVKMFDDYVKDSINYTPAFKEYGLRLVRFGKEEPQLFKIVFLMPNAQEDRVPEVVKVCVDAMKSDYDLTEEQAYQLFNRLWIFGCGLALISSSGAENLTEEQISDELSQQFVSVLSFLKNGQDVSGVTPHVREEGEPMTLELDW